MKTTTDKLFKLIKSMTPAEKRYFKRHYGSESNTLTHLYDAINLQKEYDEESIKVQFPGKVAINLKVYKFQLEQLLLKSLTSHRNGSSVGNKIRMGLEHFEILLEKNLLQMASKQLSKTKQTCLKHEKYAYLPILLAKEAKLHQIQDNNFSSKVPFTHEDTAIYAEKVQAHYRQSSKLNALIDLYHQSKLPINKGALKNFLKEIAISSPKYRQDIPISDQLIPTITKGVQHLLIGEYKIAEEILSEVIDYFSKHPKKAGHYAHFYLNSLYSAIDASLQLKEFNKVQEYIKDGQKFCEKHPLHLTKVFNFAIYEIQLSIHNNSTSSFINKRLPKLEALIDEMDLERKLTIQLFYGWTALAALFAEKEQLSEVLIQKIQESPEEKMPFTIALGRILEFVVYFETPNFQKINQYLNRIKNEKKIKLSEADKMFYDCFLKFADELAINPRSARDMAQQFLEKLDQIPNDGNLLQLFLSFKLDHWLNAIVTESAFLEKINNTETV